MKNMWTNYTIYVGRVMAMPVQAMFRVIIGELMLIVLASAILTTLFSWVVGTSWNTAMFSAIAFVSILLEIIISTLAYRHYKRSRGLLPR